MKLYWQIRECNLKVKLVMYMYNVFELEFFDKDVKIIVFSQFFKVFYEERLFVVVVSIVFNGFCVEVYKRNL